MNQYVIEYLNILINDRWNSYQQEKLDQDQDQDQDRYNKNVSDESLTKAFEAIEIYLYKSS